MVGNLESNHDSGDRFLVSQAFRYCRTVVLHTPSLSLFRLFWESGLMVEAIPLLKAFDGFEVTVRVSGQHVSADLQS
jgi:hypothetical protein